MTGYPVKLYVYDLSRGLARQMSMQFVGKQIDGVWHTSVVFKGVEYYYGAGVQTASPGGTHHGQPLEVVDMGESSLSEDVVLEYLESLKDIYRAENYDLFMHNCNNFSQDLCQFLVGKDIPKHITGLPQEVLNTPFGQMMKPMIEQSLRPITTAPSAPVRASSAMATEPLKTAPEPTAAHRVEYLTSAIELQNIIKNTHCVSVFFTSSTCGPCKIAYPKYDELAERYGDQCTFVKIDINKAYEIAQQWRISATPTFKTFVDGDVIDDWKGASPPTLESNVDMLIQIAYPPHPHQKLSLRLIFHTSNRPITYDRVPPLDKIAAKLKSSGINEKILFEVIDFIKAREAGGAREAPVPNLSVWASFVQGCLSSGTSGESLFPIIDLFRVASKDIRVASWFAEEPTLSTIDKVITYANGDMRPYQVRLVTLQLLCNLFTCHLFLPHLCNELSASVSQLTTNSLLDSNSNVRLAASSLALNFTAYGQKRRIETGEEALGDISIELLVALIEGIERESDSGPTLNRLLTSLGLLLYCVPAESELFEICSGLESVNIIKRKKAVDIADKALCTEVLQLLSIP
ncbi:PPPDE putative peptidase domain-containing protein [Lipomyces arxii]|uniref:PPPDE putative peptidase domain-containing protein n=1 Tax=Lipomyces arxii TaxID=56418 RepID=UPI0034CD50AA